MPKTPRRVRCNVAHPDGVYRRGRVSEPPMRAFRRTHLAAAALALLCGAATALGQDAAGGELSQARSALIVSTEAHKSSTEELLRLVTEEAARLSAAHEQLRQLHADGIVSRKELEEGERLLADARGREENLRRQMADSDRLIAETEQAEKLAKSRPAASSSSLIRSSIKFNSTAVVIRYTGRTHSAVAGLGGVQAFFASTFRRPLPLSAVGQSATHDRFGYDHQHAVDVPLHPDSAEGRAVISYLQAQGITFTAFRAAIPGVATGPHIHIGRPSNRLS